MKTISKLKKPSGVRTVSSFDLSPIIVEDLEVDKEILNFKNPLILYPYIEEDSIICVKNEELGIDVYGFNREELVSNLFEELDVIYRNYAFEEDEKLNEGAKRLKSDLLNILSKTKIIQ